MNIIEKNYSPKLDVKDTQIALQIIEDELIERLNNKISFFKVRQPLVSHDRVSVANTKDKGNRQINFDSSNDNNIYYIYDDFKYWLKNSISKLEVKNNNGIALTTLTIERDSEIKNTQSMEKRRFIIEYRYDVVDKEKMYEKALELNDVVYGVIKDVQRHIGGIYPELKKSILPEVTDKKELKKISSKHNIQESIANVASEEGAFLLLDKRNPKTDRNLSNTFVISLQAYKHEIDEAYRIYKIQDRRTLTELESFTSEYGNAMEEFLFAKETLIDKDINTLHIEVDLDALSMLILQKTHIAEIQSGKTIDEIEKIFSDANLKHL